MVGFGDGKIEQTATEELEDFFGADSDGDSDKGIRDRNKVVNAMKPGALAASNAFGKPFSACLVYLSV